jgi:hypothetical protein
MAKASKWTGNRRARMGTGQAEKGCSSQVPRSSLCIACLRRGFNLAERVELDVRTEYFNVFNHPMFGAPGATEPDSELGIAGSRLATAEPSGGQSPLYALGGPRSAQFAIKLMF